MKNYEIKAIAITVAIFIASGIASFREVRYRLWSEPATADITKIERVRGKRDVIKGTNVTYSFFDDSSPDAARVDTSYVSGAWPPDDQKRLEIQYIPGSPGSSRATIRQQFWPLVVFPIGLVVGIITFIFLRDAHRDLKERKNWTPSKG